MIVKSFTQTPEKTMTETAETATIPMDKLAKTYRKIRDQKVALTAEYDAKLAVLDEKLDTLTHAMRDQMKAAGVTSVKTPEGTVIMSTSTRYSVQDWDAFKSFVIQHDALDLFERRVAQRNTEQFLEANPTLAIPSLMTDSKLTISVRKPGVKV